MSRVMLCAAVLTAAGVLVREPLVRGQAQDAASVLAAAHQVLGGDRNLAAVKTFLATGRARQLRGDNLVPIEFEIACELPDKYVRRDEFPAQDSPPVVNGFRGEEAIGPSKTTREDFARLMLGGFAAAPPAFPLTFAYAAEAEAPEVTNDNLGVGGYSGPDRAYSTDTEVNTLRLQHFGPVGRRAFSRSRIQLIQSDSSSQSAVEAPTIQVLDSFTSGGAQQAGGNHGTTLDVASDLDYVIGRHSLRTGFVFDATHYRSDASTNYLGTYTFDSLTAYEANLPSNYTRRIGDPSIVYDNVQAGFYVQDDIRVRKNLSLTPGLRYEVQRHVGDRGNVGPRFGLTWAPTASGQTTIRASAGIFYDWLPTSTYDQVVRLDGFHQQEINVVDPSFPVDESTATVPPVNRYALSPNYDAPRTTRFSTGIDQAIRKVSRVSVTYSYLRGSRLARGLNVNPVIDGVRADPRFANVIDVVSDAASRQHELRFDASINPGAMLPLPASAPRIDWKRTTVFANYTLSSLQNNTDGPFSPPPTGTLATEWGPANGGSGSSGTNIPGLIAFGGAPTTVDVRHRVNVSLNNQVVRNVVLSLGVNASSAPPYTLLTGEDNNGDGIFNDRPPGVGRNTQRASGQMTVNMLAGYNFAFGHSSARLPPGIGVFGSGAAAQVRSVDLGPARYRLQLFVQAQNLTNEANYLGYSGTLTSPFFGKPTAVSGMRKIDFGINFGF